MQRTDFDQRVDELSELERTDAYHPEMTEELLDSLVKAHTDWADAAFLELLRGEHGFELRVDAYIAISRGFIVDDAPLCFAYGCAYEGRVGGVRRTP